jgi:5-methylcytosine-specific restriction endonuclease McrA
MALTPCLNCGTLSRSGRCPTCTSYYRKVTGSQAWKRTRAYVRARDGECADCGATAGLQVHHEIPVGDGGDPFDADQLVLLCGDCHNQFTFA